MVEFRSNIETEDLKDVTDKFDIQVFRWTDPDFGEDTIILRVRDSEKSGEFDGGFNIGVANCKKYIEYLDKQNA